MIIEIDGNKGVGKTTTTRLLNELELGLDIRDGGRMSLATEDPTVIPEAGVLYILLEADILVSQERLKLADRSFGEDALIITKERFEEVAKRFNATRIESGSVLDPVTQILKALQELSLKEERVSSTLVTLQDTLEERVEDPTGYTGKLLGDPNLMIKKLGEEHAEVLQALMIGTKEEMAEESADLLFHLFVALRSKGVSPGFVTLMKLKRSFSMAGLLPYKIDGKRVSREGVFVKELPSEEEALNWVRSQPRSTTFSSSRYGPCEICGMQVAEVFVVSGLRGHVHFGHEECLKAPDSELLKKSREFCKTYHGEGS